MFGLLFNINECHKYADSPFFVCKKVEKTGGKKLKFFCRKNHPEHEQSLLKVLLYSRVHLS